METREITATHHISGDYVLTGIPNAFNSQVSYWMSKKGFTVSFYCFSARTKREVKEHLAHFDVYIDYFEHRLAAACASCAKHVRAIFMDGSAIMAKPVLGEENTQEDASLELFYVSPEGDATELAYIIEQSGNPVIFTRGSGSGGFIHIFEEGDPAFAEPVDDSFCIPKGKEKDSLFFEWD